MEKLVIVDGDLSLGPEPLWSAVINLLIVGFFFIIGYRAIKLISFDEQYAKVNGIKTQSWNIIFLIITSITVVVSFSSVGAILVIGFIVIPPATAMLLSTKFGSVLALSSVLTVISCIVGIRMAQYLDVSMAGSICVAMGGLFFLVFFYDMVKRNFVSSKHVVKIEHKEP